MAAVALPAEMARADVAAGQIAFTSNRGGSAQLYVMNSDGSNQTRVSRSFPYDDTQPSWSPNGTSLVFTRGNGYQSSALVHSSIMSVDLATGREQLLNDDAGVNFKPAYSPDGRWIVYVHGAALATNGPFDLWLMRPDGTDRHPLTAAGDVTQPSWSPDGRSIVVNRGSGLAIVSVATGIVRALPAPPAGAADYTPSWGPRGIVFTSTRGGGGKQIYVTDPSGNSVRRLMDDGAEDKYPTWSPDNRHIVYSRSTVPCSASGGAVAPGGECSLTQLGGFEVFIIGADGSAPRRLTFSALPESQFGESYPVWRRQPPAARSDAAH